MQRRLLRALCIESSHLVDQGCPNEARIKIASVFGKFEMVKLFTLLDLIQQQEKGLPRNLERYRDTLTERLLSHIREKIGTEGADKILNSLANKPKG